MGLLLLSTNQNMNNIYIRNAKKLKKEKKENRERIAETNGFGEN